MGKRAQAGLEYLVTYGWALAFISVVFGLIFFLVNTPSSDVRCSTSDPAKIITKGFKIPYSPVAVAACSEPCEKWGFDAGGLGIVVLQNFSGASMEITSVTMSESPVSRNGCHFVKVFEPVQINGRDRAGITAGFPLLVEAGGLIEIEPLHLSIENDGSSCGIPGFGFDPWHSFTIYYFDQFNLQREVTVNCGDFPPKE